MVPRRFLQVLAGPDREPFAMGSGRLELARAIVDPDNPLTARVWVNRVWMHHFGAGLVRTPSDFGTRAEPPSHPELLDWLAGRFVAEGWSLKRLHRLILLSATYRQRSDGPEDPSSRERAIRARPREPPALADEPSTDCSFEELRDALLRVTGGARPPDRRPAGGPVSGRRTRPVGRSTALVDREILPSVLRVFDFANPGPA